MLQSLAVHIHPAVVVRQRTLCNKGRRSHRRGHVKHVIESRNRFAGIQIAKHGLAPITEDLNQFLAKVTDDLLAFDHLFQCLAIAIHGEDVGKRRSENDLTAFSNTRFSKRFIREIHDLLRSTTTLHGPRWHRENCRATFEVFDILPRRIDGVIRVIAADTVLRHSFFQPGNPVPVKLQTGGDDQPVIRDDLAVPSSNQVLVRLESGNSIFDPAHSLWHHRLHRPAGDLLWHYTTAD